MWFKSGTREGPALHGSARAAEQSQELLRDPEPERIIRPPIQIENGEGPDAALEIGTRNFILGFAGTCA